MRALHGLVAKGPCSDPQRFLIENFPNKDHWSRFWQDKNPGWYLESFGLQENVPDWRGFLRKKREKKKKNLVVCREAGALN